LYIHTFRVEILKVKGGFTERERQGRGPPEFAPGQGGVDRKVKWMDLFALFIDTR
jgi:hypothetical protein